MFTKPVKPTLKTRCATRFPHAYLGEAGSPTELSAQTLSLQYAAKHLSKPLRRGDLRPLIRELQPVEDERIKWRRGESNPKRFIDSQRVTTQKQRTTRIPHAFFAVDHFQASGSVRLSGDLPHA